MLEVSIRWPYEGEFGSKGSACVAQVVPAGAGCTLKVNASNEFEPHFDVDEWDAAKIFYSFPATKAEWKHFWETIRRAASEMGERVEILDIHSHLTGPEPIPFPDSVRPREAA